jgi:hypothetical protein
MAARNRPSSQRAKSAPRTPTLQEQWSALPRAIRKTAEEKLYSLAEKHGLARDQIVDPAMGSYARSKFRFDIGYPKPLNNFEIDLIKAVAEAFNHQPTALSAPGSRRIATPIVIRDKAQVLQYSRIVIAALEEIVEYDPKQHHNRPPPQLRIEDEAYLQDIQRLIAELTRLNDLLESKQPRKTATKRALINVRKHFDTFFGKLASSFGTTLGTGAGGLLIGSVAALLYQAGFDGGLVMQILSHFRLSR